MRIQGKILPVVFGGVLFWSVSGCEKQQSGAGGAVEVYDRTASAAEQTQPYITTRDVNVRSGPGTEHRIIAEIAKDTKVNVSGREGEWLRVVSKQGNPPGYIHESYARPMGEPIGRTAPAIRGMYVTTVETYVRKGPGLHYPVVARIPKDVKVHVVGAEGEWLKVESKHGNPPGYIEKVYARRLETR